jgi:hypothetical protein
MSRKLYGLFFNNYDYHEWKNLYCVSEDKKKLREYHKNLTGDEELIPKTKYNHYRDYEIDHYIILPLEVL